MQLWKTPLVLYTSQFWEKLQPSPNTVLKLIQTPITQLGTNLLQSNPRTGMDWNLMLH